jgi:hypothetical protein
VQVSSPKLHNEFDCTSAWSSTLNSWGAKGEFQFISYWSNMTSTRNHTQYSFFSCPTNGSKEGGGGSNMRHKICILVSPTTYVSDIFNVIADKRNPAKINGVNETYSGFVMGVTIKWHGRAIAQAVSRRPFAAEARVQSRVGPCAICGGQSGTGTGFSPSTSVFPCQFHSTGAPLKWKNRKNLITFLTVLHNKPPSLRCVRSICYGALR